MSTPKEVKMRKAQAGKILMALREQASSTLQELRAAGFEIDALYTQLRCDPDCDNGAAEGVDYVSAWLTDLRTDECFQAKTD